MKNGETLDDLEFCFKVEICCLLSLYLSEPSLQWALSRSKFNPNVQFSVHSAEWRAEISFTLSRASTTLTPVDHRHQGQTRTTNLTISSPKRWPLRHLTTYIPFLDQFQLYIC